MIILFHEKCYSGPHILWYKKRIVTRLTMSPILPVIILVRTFGCRILPFRYYSCDWGRGEWAVLSLVTIITRSKNCSSLALITLFIFHLSTARTMTLGKNEIPYCEKSDFPGNKCNSDTWLFTMQIRDSHCTWWLKDCKLKKGAKTICEEWEHMYDSMICYKVRCP